MFRAGSVLAMGALIGVLATGIASARTGLAAHIDPISLSREIFAQCFDLAGTAPSRPHGVAFAFQMPANLLPPTGGDTDLASFPIIRITDMAYVPHRPTARTSGQAGRSPSFDTDYAMPAPSVDAVTTLSPEPIESAATIGYVRAPAPSATASAPQYRFDLPSTNGRSAFSLSPVLNPTTGFTASDIGADANASLPQTQADVTVPVRVGHVHLSTHAVAGQAQSAALALRDRSVGGGATFDARLGKQKLGVDVSSDVEHLEVNQPSFNASSIDGTANVGLSGDNVPVFIPAYADVTKHTLSAGVAVPVSKRVTAAVQVDEQHLLGGYGAPGLQNLDANNFIYGARVTYQLKGNAALSLSAKATQFRDNLLPANAFNATSANLNLTVKF